MKEDLYRRLQRHLDRLPVPFPATESGVEIRLLRRLFTEEEAELVLCLSALPERAEKIHRRLKPRRTLEQVEQMLRRMMHRGVILGRESKKDRQLRFSKMPLAIGMFEGQVDRVSPGFAADFFEYEAGAFGNALRSMATQQLRTIPVDIAIEPHYQAGHYDRVREIIRRSPGPFAVMNCICRQAQDRLDNACPHTDIRETCLMIEGGVTFARHLGVGREVSREEMLKLLTQAKKAGLVLQPENSQKPNFICCCCGCCCAVMRIAKRHPRPAEFMHANFLAQVNTDRCDACETCMERCQIDAIRRVNNHVEVDADRCIGCGLCVPTCPEKAMKLAKREREWVPPPNTMDLYRRIYLERFGLLHGIRFMGRSALGLQV
jgi:Na+-translocating ferredoxin:NAD+ oxidoreductase subunit B